MRLVAPTILTVVVAATAVAAGSASTPPPGATARCRDGTYSFSQHHQGTCSHHGGVAVWLDGSSSGGSTTSSLNLGRTILLAPRTRTSGCALRANPDRRCSPGAYYSRLTKSTICASSFRTSQVRNVPESEKFAVEREYGLPAGHYGSALEIDHIVSLELGGSNDIANLFPEKVDAHPGYKVKDKLENRLHDLVCNGTLALRTVRERIASNWQALYKTVFGVPSSG